MSGAGIPSRFLAHHLTRRNSGRMKSTQSSMDETGGTEILECCSMTSGTGALEQRLFNFLRVFLVDTSSPLRLRHHPIDDTF